MALELVALVAVSVSALMLAWKYQQAQQSLRFLVGHLKFQSQMLSEYQQSLENLQLEDQPEPSVYQVQLQLRNQDLLAQVAQLQSENQELKAQLGYQQRLEFPQVATQAFVTRPQGEQLLAQCHCKNQGSCQSDCC